MDALTLLAAEVTEHSLWYPTVQGILVTICALALFCGSVYMLLATNVGARLGFLVAFTGLMGFMVVLTLLWLTTSSPLNTLKGSIPAWEVAGVFDSLDEEGVPDAVRDIEEEGTSVDDVKAAEVKAAIDENLVRQTPVGEEELPEGANEFAIFDDVTEFLVTDTYEIGGSEPNPLLLEFTHDPLWAAARFCTVQDLDTLPGLPPPEPACDPNAATGVMVLERNLGSLRFPPFIAFLSVSILFGLGLLSLHWFERDRQRAARSKTLTPAPV